MSASVQHRADVERALALVRELLDVARDGSDRHPALFLAELTRMCVLAGDVELAETPGRGLSVEAGRAGAARAAAAATLAQ